MSRVSNRFLIKIKNSQILIFKFFLVYFKYWSRIMRKQKLQYFLFQILLYTKFILIMFSVWPFSVTFLRLVRTLSVTFACTLKKHKLVNFMPISKSLWVPIYTRESFALSSADLLHFTES